jgi:5'-phosphate synthase pdxT subunit
MKRKNMKIGVLALQGAFIEHIAVLNRLHIDPVEVRLPAELNGLSG